MRITPRPIEIGEEEGFSEERDLFGFKDFGDRFANIVMRAELPMTVVLDGQWGSGKSTFAKQWVGHLKGRGASVILLDAFESDYQQSPFVALATALGELAEASGIEAEVTAGFRERAVSLGRLLAPAVAKVAVRAATAGLVDADAMKAAGGVVTDLVRSASGDLEDLAGETVKQEFADARDGATAVESFRAALEQLADALAAKKAEEGFGRSRLIFVVDELDRCRPDFALGVLERIKHAFAVNGVCFVLVTHLGQLGGVVRARYGVKPDMYLEKFYSLRVTLPDPEGGDGVTPKYVQYLFDELRISFMGNPRAGARLLSKLAIVHGAPLRTIERIASSVALASLSAEDTKFSDPAVVIPLCVMRHLKPDLYRSVRAGSASWGEVREFLGEASDDDDDYEHEFAIGFWGHLLGEVKADDVATLLRKYRFRGSEGVVPHCCILIDGLFVPGS